VRETAIHKSMGLTRRLGNGEGKHSMSQERGEGENSLQREGRLASRALEMRPFGEAKSISGHQTLQLMRRTGEACTLSHSLPSRRCLEDGPDAAERRPGSGFPTSRGTGDGHLEAHHDLQATPARPGKATRLGVRGSIVPAASRTSYSSFWKVGVRDLFSATDKNQRSRFDSAQPNDTSNTNDLCLPILDSFQISYFSPIKSGGQ